MRLSRILLPYLALASRWASAQDSMEDRRAERAARELAERWTSDAGAVGLQYSILRENVTAYLQELTPPQILASTEFRRLRYRDLPSPSLALPMRTQKKLIRDLDSPYRNAEVARKIEGDAKALSEAIQEIHRWNEGNVPVRFYLGGSYARGRVGAHSDVDLFLDTSDPKFLEEARFEFTARSRQSATPVGLAAYHRDFYLWWSFTPFADLGDGRRFLESPTQTLNALVAERRFQAVSVTPVPLARLFDAANQGRVDLQRIEGVDLFTRLAQGEAAAEGETKSILREARAWLQAQPHSILESLDRPLIQPLGAPESKELTLRIRSALEFASVMEYFGGERDVLLREALPPVTKFFSAASMKGRVRHEAGAVGTFVAAYLLKETLKAMETPDPAGMRAAAGQLKTAAFWGNLFVFTVAARAADKLPLKGLARSTVPLAVGMAAVQFLSGNYSLQDLAITTGSFLAAGVAVNLLADGLLYPALFAAGPPGWAGAGVYTVAKLAVTLYAGEKLETWMRSMLGNGSGREGVKQILDRLAPEGS